MNDRLICIAVCADRVDHLIEQLRRAENDADVIEIRFDCLAKSELARAVSAIGESRAPTPLIATYRSPDQGGGSALTREDRLEFWRSLGEGFAYVDLENDVIDDVEASATIIASHHDLDAISDDVGLIYQQLAGSETSIIKIAATAPDICDAIPIWKLLVHANADNRRIIPIAMGESGKWTRILGLAHGAFLTYASLDSGRETAGGQLTAHDLIDVYRVKELDANTGVYGVIGDPVSSSLSPYMHNAAFAVSGVNAVFLPLEVKDLDAFMRRMVLPATREIDLNFAGFAVTMPHKQAIMKYLDAIDPIAEAVGAVNTVKIDNGKLSGYNTDAHGVIEPLKARIPDLKNVSIAVLGAGGAARAVVYALNCEAANITVVARDLAKAGTLADQFNIELTNLATDHRPSTFDILINTTPLGMRGPNETKSPLTAKDLLGVRFVYDLVTRRDDTPLIREAKKAGVPALGGFEMLIAQGQRQFEIWTGLEPPADVMRKAVLDRLG